MEFQVSTKHKLESDFVINPAQQVNTILHQMKAKQLNQKKKKMKAKQNRTLYNNITSFTHRDQISTRAKRTI